MATWSDSALQEMVREIGERLTACSCYLATAESCTGGWVAKLLTDQAGSSAWFDCGFVTYSNPSKERLLGVAAATLEKCGAVSEETVREMAEGALRRSAAHVSVAISGIAGPTGGTATKPVGTVWFAWAARQAPTRVRSERFAGDREAVRRQAAGVALKGLLDGLVRGP